MSAVTSNPTVLTQPQRRPSAKAPLLWALSAALPWVALLIVQAVFAGFDHQHLTRWWHTIPVLVTIVVGSAHVIIAPRVRYRVHRWEISDEAMYVRSGWLTTERRIAPISRLQTVDTKRGPLERLLGLATVTISTASAHGAIHIEALDVPVADEVAAQLTDIAARNAMDAT